MSTTRVPAALLLALAAPTALAVQGTPPSRGELLLGELGCVRCHAVPDAVRARLAPKSAPLLDDVAGRVTPQFLRRHLTDPHGTKPGTTMPDLLARLDANQRRMAVDPIVHFLASLGEPLDVAPVPVHDDEIEEGRQLFHEVGCVACHEPLENLYQLAVPFWELRGDETPEELFEDEDSEPSPDTLPAPAVPLGDLARKATVDALTRFLLDPLAVRPSGRMPALKLTEGEARAIALYLLRDQASAQDSHAAPGLAFEYFEAVFSGAVAEVDDLEPVRRGAALTLDAFPEHRGDDFAFRFRGFVAIERAGDYTFSTTSDDGSRLWIDGELVVQNDGQHPMVERSGSVRLEPGLHAITVVAFEHHGQEGFEARWEGPGVPRGPIPTAALSHRTRAYAPTDAAPFRLDRRQADAGAQLFDLIGCASCHVVDDPRVPRDSVRKAPALFDLDPAATDGCAAERPRPGLPLYDLEPADRAAVAAALREREALRRPLDAAARIDHTMARQRCTACHERGGIGGPDPTRSEYFFELGDVDLGEQGRIPPPLDHTGWKLRRSWIEAVLLEGGGVRPYLATRMPQFGAENVAHLVDAFASADSRPGDDVEPTFDLAEVESGRRLVGTLGGLGCVQCHTFAGFDSLGIPAVDLATVNARIKPQWFHTLLRDPKALGLNTRMPELWVDGRSPVADVHGGDVELQIDAIRVYLSLGASMPLPTGLVVPEGEYELHAAERPVTVGVFMQGVSPRTVLVGNPEHMHYAFDVEGSRLAKAWRGRFFNAKGTWHARAGALEVPPGEDVLDLAQGAPFALLDSREASWPAPADVEPPRVLGRRFDGERRPIFRYAVGDHEIEEQPLPDLREGGSWLVRRFRVARPVGGEGGSLGFRAATGTKIERRSARTWIVDDRLVVRLPAWAEAEVREDLGSQALTFAVPFESSAADESGRQILTFEVELTW